MIQDVMADAESRMAKAMDALRRDLGTIRTGRASPSLVERLSVAECAKAAVEARDLGIPAIAIFPYIDGARKDAA